MVITGRSDLSLNALPVLKAAVSSCSETISTITVTSEVLLSKLLSLVCTEEQTGQCFSESTVKLLFNHVSSESFPAIRGVSSDGKSPLHFPSLFLQFLTFLSETPSCYQQERLV